MSVALVAFVLSFAGSAALLIGARSHAFGMVEPSADRWHRRATPGLGGVPMFAAFAAAATVGGALDDDGTRAILAGALILFGIGLVDDLRGLGATAKLCAQTLAALLVVAAGDAALLGPDAGAYRLALGTVWIVAITNGINLLDNMDGLAGGASLIAAATVLILAAGDTASAALAPLCIALCGALAGFLALNVNPARLFMGDVGSQWLGLVTGATSLASMTGAPERLGNSPLVWLLPVLICALPVMDTAMVIVTRRARGQPVSRGGRDHLSHRLVGLGLSERSSVALLWSIAVAGALVALSIAHLRPAASAPLVGLFAIAACAFTWRVGSTSLDGGETAAGPVPVAAPKTRGRTEE